MKKIISVLFAVLLAFSTYAQSNSELLYQEAVKLYNRGEYGKAKKEFQEVIKLNDGKDYQQTKYYIRLCNEKLNPTPPSEKKPYEKDPVVLYVDGQRIKRENLGPEGGIASYKITLSDGSISECRLSVDKDWIQAQLTSDGILRVSYLPNTGKYSRSGNISVCLRDSECCLVFNQEREKNSIEDGTWYSQLFNLISNPTQEYNGGDKYTGSLYNEKRSGYGVYYFSGCGNFHIGQFQNNLPNGKAIYVTPPGYYISNLQDCLILVSDFVDNKPNGEMSCYDEFGYLIYEGPVLNWRPLDKYPMKSDNNRKKFEYKDINGQYYFGETVDGKLCGTGILFYTEKICKFGTWTDGQFVSGNVISN